MIRIACLLSVLVLVLGIPPALAEEPEAPSFGGRAPPDMPSGPEAYMTPTDRTDLLAFVQALHRQIAQFKDPPPSTQDVTALRDAWNAILRPRIGRMTKRLEKWSDASRWIYLEGEEHPVALKPDQWTAFTRDMASLATELHGAWKQYGTVKLKPKESMSGHGYMPRGRPLTRLAYPWPTMYGSIMDRQTAGGRLGRWDSHSYWHLLGRFRYAWDWSYLRRQQWYEYWRRRRQATKKLFDDLRSELNGTRDTLGETLMGVQVFVAALQNAEEERMQEECIPCKTKDETLVKMAETALEGMHTARLNGESFQGRSSSGYGTILRKWLRSQKAATKVLRIAVEEQEAAEAEEAEEAKEAKEAAGASK